MSALNDTDLTAFAFKEALARERHMSVKLKFFGRSTRDMNMKDLCAGLLASCESRINILQKEMKNLNIK
jgi:hypothetical protein